MRPGAGATGWVAVDPPITGGAVRLVSVGGVGEPPHRRTDCSKGRGMHSDRTRLDGPVRAQAAAEELGDKLAAQTRTAAEATEPHRLVDDETEPRRHLRTRDLAASDTRM